MSELAETSIELESAQPDLSDTVVRISFILLSWPFAMFKVLISSVGSYVFVAGSAVSTLLLRYWWTPLKKA